MRLEISQIVGENCMTPEQGQEIYVRIHPELMAGQSVVLDFAGMDIFAVPFFNYAIGQLLKDIAPEDLNRLLIFSNLNPVGMNV